MRAQECATARDAGRSIDPTPCTASVRDRFQATVHAFRSPLLRRGLKFASVIAELPAPEHCIDHPDDADWGYGGLPKSIDEYRQRYEKSIQVLTDLKAKGVAGGVYTQTTDVEGEVNGFMTYDRKKIKIKPEALRELNDQLKIR